MKKLTFQSSIVKRILDIYKCPKTKKVLSDGGKKTAKSDLEHIALISKKT
jgi:hypothetical protein